MNAPSKARVTSKDIKLADQLVAKYSASEELIERFRSSLENAIKNSSLLKPHIHSVKSRLKDPKHLHDKLLRKMAKCREEGRDFDITPSDLLVRINDLVGIRILHLHTRQVVEIDRAIRQIVEEESCSLVEGPFARTWDDESRAFYEACGIDWQLSPNMYTSVHYVVGSASKTTITCELQVRTLMEEAWGEVDHLVNYPNHSDMPIVREQLRVLARLVSGSTRLVDTIFMTHAGAAE